MKVAAQMSSMKRRSGSHAVIPQLAPTPLRPRWRRIAIAVGALSLSASGLLILPAAAAPLAITTTTTLTSSSISSVSGESVTFTATVAPMAPATGTPTGSVTFKDGTTTIGTINLNAKSPDVAAFTTSALSVKSHSITADYLGATGTTAYAGSNSALLSQVVSAASTTTALSPPAGPLVSGQPITLTATVAVTTPGSGTPTGSVTFKDGTTTLGTSNLNGLAADVATYTTSTKLLASGSPHSLTATYSASTSDLGSVSKPVSLTVGLSGTTTAFTVTPPQPWVSGQALTILATVAPLAPGTGTPTGTVTFYNGSTKLGSGTLNKAATDQTTFVAKLPAAATNSLTAVYAGDTNYNTSTTTNVIEPVAPAQTTTVLQSSKNPSVNGQPVTFTATVTVKSPGSGTPTGQVTFTNGSTTLGTGTLGANGVATYATSTLSVGAAHTITATYGGDANDAASLPSTALSQVVNADPTNTTISSSANPSVIGQPVTFTATVAAAAPGAGIPSGTVTFNLGTSTLTGTLNGKTPDQATVTTSSLPFGTAQSITATYGTDGDFASSTSAALAQTINAAQTVTTVTSSKNPSPSGTPVTYTATVAAKAPGAGTPTGTVTFEDGTTVLCSPVPLGTQGATCVESAFTQPGSHTITATFSSATKSFVASTGSLTQVNRGPTTTALTSTPNPSVSGQSVTYTATVKVSAGTGAPTGQVSFYDGTTLLGTGALNGASTDAATFSTGFAVFGTSSITATYAGSASFTASTSPVLTQTVHPAGTTTAVSAAPNPSVSGQSVTLTATVAVTAPGTGAPAGTVDFYDGTTLLGTGSLNGLSPDTATFSVGLPAAGSPHQISATYVGTAAYATSTSGKVAEIVTKSATTTTLSAPSSTSVSGEHVTYSAMVAPTAPGTGTASGTVAFFEAGTAIPSCSARSLTSGVATCSLTYAGPGPHAITAVYSGDSNFTISTSGPLAHSVNQAATTTALTSDTSPSVIGQSVTFTATVTATTPGAGTPTGTVSFFDGTTSFGTGTLAGGVATFTTSSLSVASHPVTAVYEGDTDFTTSTSNPALTQTVNQDATSASVTSATSPSVFGQSVTFTATVTPSAPGAGTPTGTVSFFDGTTSLGTGTLDASGVATSPPTAGLSVGDHAITAVYDGDTDFTASTSAAFTQTVNQGATSTSVTGAPGPSVFGQSVTFTATVTPSAPGAGTPTGTVSFFDGTTSFGTGTLAGGVATFTTSSLSVASHPVTAVYEGDTDFTTSTSTAFSQTVGKASTDTFVFSSSPSLAGQSVTFDVTVLAKGPGAGFPTGGVTLYENGTAFSCGPSGLVVLDGSGKGTCSTTYPLPGAYAITASYPGDPNFLASTSGQSPTQTVNRDQTGYSVVAGNGALFTYGDATSFGTVAPSQLNKPLIGLVKTPDEQGYWEVAADGGVFTFGDARFYGSMGGQHLNAPVVGIASTPDGKGYWEVASDGGIFAFGDAHFYGSMGGQHLNRPVVGIASTPSGNGYWEVASDGGVFAFGDAAPHGNTVGIHLNSPIVGIAATPDGTGYWLVGADGGVFAEGSATFYGSMAGKPLNRPVVGILATPNGKGYWLVGADGGVFDFGGAGFFSDPALPVSGAPIIGIG